MTSIIKVDQIQTVAGGVPTAADLGLNTTGTVLQVKSVNTQSHQSHSTTTFAQFSGLDISITPTSASSKILISYNVFAGQAQDDNYLQFVVRKSVGGGSNVDVRNGASVGGASLVSWANNGPYTHAVYEVHASSWQYLDSPATTSQIDYKLFARAMATTARTMYLNRPHDVGDANRSSTTSTVTVMEIAG